VSACRPLKCRTRLVQSQAGKDAKVHCALLKIKCKNKTNKKKKKCTLEIQLQYVLINNTVVRP
jgi:hypothetical protein